MVLLTDFGDRQNVGRGVAEGMSKGNCLFDEKNKIDVIAGFGKSVLPVKLK
jgi:hypothetical protein